MQFVQPLDILSHFTFRRRQVVHERGFSVGAGGEALSFGVLRLLLRKGGDMVVLVMVGASGEWIDGLDMIHFLGQIEICCLLRMIFEEISYHTDEMDVKYEMKGQLCVCMIFGYQCLSG